MSKTFDLSTLNLSAGTHEITVKARASGYLDSAPSNAVSYVVAEETTYKLSGTWVFNETVYCEMVYEDVAFTSNGEMFSSIYTDDSAGGVIEYDSTTVYYRSEKWTGYEAYRTITFDGEQTVSQEFYDWFTGEAVKQEEKITDLTGTTWKFNSLNCTAEQAIFLVDFTATSGGYEYNGDRIGVGYGRFEFDDMAFTNPTVNSVTTGAPYAMVISIGDSITFTDGRDVTNTALIDWLYANAKQLITFTIDGTTYQAESGMTWGEWCGSEYNTANAYDNGNIYGSSGKPLFEGEGYTWADIKSEYAVLTDELIIANHAYYSMTGGFD